MKFTTTLTLLASLAAFAKADQCLISSLKIVAYKDDECKTADSDAQAKLDEDFEYMKKVINECTKADATSYLGFSCDAHGMTTSLYDDETCTK